MKKVLFACIGILLSVLCYFYFQQPRLHFIQDEIHIALHDEVKPYDYIEKVSHMDIEELQIQNLVNKDQLGEYKILYHYGQKTFTLKVYVDDVIPPQFEVKNTKLLRNETVDPQTLVENIQDDSKTTVYFKEDYLFNQLKTYCTTIVVEDSYHNKTEKNAYILVEEKDSEPPIIEGLQKISAVKGKKIDLKKGITLHDDHDQDPILTIDDSKLDINKVGHYQVIYHVKDNSGNQQSYTRDVEIVSPYSDKEAVIDGVKTCYLTFDDGPSVNTKDVLDILDRYQIKATFFVTGTYPEYYSYMKKAHDKGHVIALHTFSHDYKTIYSSVNGYMNDLQKIKDLVYQQTGVDSKIIRFPGGSNNQSSKQYSPGIMKILTKKVIDEGYQYYDWTSLNGDGEGVTTVEGLYKKAMQEIEGKEDIMFLMHDSATCQNTVKALPAILDELVKRGYTFHVIDENTPTFHQQVK